MPNLPLFQPQGRDSVVGASALLNPRAIAVHRALVPISGTTFRIRPSVLRELMEQVAVLDRAGLDNALTKPFAFAVTEPPGNHAPGRRPCKRVTIWDGT